MYFSHIPFHSLLMRFEIRTDIVQKITNVYVNNDSTAEITNATTNAIGTSISKTLNNNMHIQVIIIIIIENVLHNDK